MPDRHVASHRRTPARQGRGPVTEPKRAREQEPHSQSDRDRLHDGHPGQRNRVRRRVVKQLERRVFGPKRKGRSRKVRGLPQGQAPGPQFLRGEFARLRIEQNHVEQLAAVPQNARVLGRIGNVRMGSGQQVDRQIDGATDQGGAQEHQLRHEPTGPQGQPPGPTPRPGGRCCALNFRNLDRLGDGWRRDDARRFAGTFGQTAVLENDQRGTVEREHSNWGSAVEERLKAGETGKALVRLSFTRRGESRFTSGRGGVLRGLSGGVSLLRHRRGVS